MLNTSTLYLAFVAMSQVISPVNVERREALLMEAAKCGGIYVVLAPTVEKLGDVGGSDALKVKYYTWLAYGDDVIKADPRIYVGSMIQSGLKDAKYANQLEAGEKNRYWNRLLDECHKVETVLGERFSAGKVRAEETVAEQRKAKAVK